MISQVSFPNIKNNKKLMLSLLKRSSRKVLKKIKEYKAILTMTQSENFKWKYYVIQERLKYKFDALRMGININKNSAANLYNFRRNVHRIEKGLSYRKIKPIFAEDYIIETVQYLQQNSTHTFLDSETKQWGEAVLTLYFKSCSHSKTISQAYGLYQTLRSKDCNTDSVPYLCSSRPQLSVDYNSLHQLALRRRSVRFYLDEIVEPALIEKALTIALQSPSACNRQSFKYLFFNEKEIVNKIAAIPGGVAGYSIPSLIILVGRYRGYFDERDVNAPIIDASLSAMAFLLALETLGLSSVCINWPNLIDREENIRQIVHLEEDEIVIMLIGVGYPASDGKVPYSAKQPVNEILSVNERLL